MTAMERIKEIEIMDKRFDDCDSWRGMQIAAIPRQYVQLLLKAFKVMRGIAFEESLYVNPSNVIAERIVDIKFEKRMKDAQV